MTTLINPLLGDAERVVRDAWRDYAVASGDQRTVAATHEVTATDVAGPFFVRGCARSR